VGGSCGTHGRGEQIVGLQGFYGKTRRKETSQKTGDVEGSVGSKWILEREIGWGGGGLVSAGLGQGPL
jgi:hypothetical protein